MKASVWTKAGPPDVLQFQEVAKPTPKENEVLIRIHATTATAADCQLRASNTPRMFRLLRLTRPGPIVLGQELAGKIEAVGSKVSRFKPGDPVVAWSGLRLGTYAEYTCLPENGVLAIKPSTMTYAEAAPLSVGGLDAAYFIRKAHIQRGQKILINGAGGSMGTFAVQLARHFGAEVTAVDSADKLDMLRSIGADHVMDYTKGDFTKSGATYDVILDVIGKSSFARSLKLLTPTGRYLLANPQLPQLIRSKWVLRTSSKKVIPWVTRTTSEYTEDFTFLKGLIEAGAIKSVIDRHYPLEQAAEAHRYVETGLKKGQVIITVA
jgi:NADPH:quinone reductase-like Zn-dependent oxidoreductase